MSPKVLPKKAAQYYGLFYYAEQLSSGLLKVEQEEQGRKGFFFQKTWLLMRQFFSHKDSWLFQQPKKEVACGFPSSQWRVGREGKGAREAKALWWVVQEKKPNR